jgi:hypothetical protein
VNIVLNFSTKSSLNFCTESSWQTLTSSFGPSTENSLPFLEVSSLTESLASLEVSCEAEVSELAKVSLKVFQLKVFHPKVFRLKSFHLKAVY